MTWEEIQSRVDHALENLRKLEEIPQATWEEFSADFRNLDSALHRLQTTIQALIDIASYASATLGLPAPGTSREVLENLEAHGHLPTGTAQRGAQMLAFRNRVVHLYERLDPRIVYRILREDRNDLKGLLDLLLAIVARVSGQ